MKDDYVFCPECNDDETYGKPISKMKSFNLSEKIVSNMVETDWYDDGEGTPKEWTNKPSVFVEDVKTFIAKLKDMIIKEQGLVDYVLVGHKLITKIDKIAGDELSGCSKQNYAKSNYHKMFNSMSQKYGKAIRRNTDMEIKFDEFIKKLKEELDRALISKADKKIAKLNIDKLVKEFKGSDKK